MKTKLNILLLLIVMIISSSCKKDDELTYSPSGYVTLGNFVVGGAALTYTPLALNVLNNYFSSFPLAAGQNQIRLFDATKPAIAPYYDQPFEVEDAGNYSLFLGGASASAVDAIKIKESYTNPTDSVCGIRFINLSPNSPAISVNIKNSAPGSEIANLTYKAYSSFKLYQAKKVNPSYVFEIRNAETSALISTYTLSVSTAIRYSNTTIILRGMVGSTPAFGVNTITHP